LVGVVVVADGLFLVGVVVVADGLFLVGVVVVADGSVRVILKAILVRVIQNKSI